TFQDQYFRSGFKLLTDPIIANNHDAFLVDAGFQRQFRELRDKLGTVEYYMIDDPQPGFLLVDARGERQVLLIFSAQTLAEHAERLGTIGAPAELQAAVVAGERLPVFDIQDQNLSVADRRIRDWRRHYQPGLSLQTQRRFHVTLVSSELLPA